MSSVTEIRGALSAQLLTLGLTTAWENNATQPTAAHVRETFLPATSNAASLGTTGLNRIEGIYQVDVYSLYGGGVGATETTIQLVLAAFKRGDTLTNETTTVIIERAYRTTGMREGKWYHVPITIDWRADIANGG